MGDIPFCLRQQTEELEEKNLSPFATKSRMSRGRLRQEPECAIRTIFQRDRDRIIHSKAFRRLKHKTQVFIAPEGDHYRTRLTHTLEVSQVARTIARALRLNEDLTEAIALGHDLGHTPFGHAGEEVLQEVHPGGFRHNEQSLRVVDVLEGNGGLNLSFEVRDGILNHTGPNPPSTLEGQVVRLADRIAYVNHDVDDAMRGGVLRLEEIPREILATLGDTHSLRINSMVTDVVRHSYGKDFVDMSPGYRQAMESLREFLFDRVYIGSMAKKEEAKAKHIVRELYCYYLNHLEEVPSGIVSLSDRPSQVVCDYVAGMTDRYATDRFLKLFVPVPWRDEF